MFYSGVKQFKDLCGYVIDDVWYPRVTKVVEIKSKPALYRFYAGLNSFSEGEKIKRNSATEGTMIHEAAQAVLTGEEPELSPSIIPSIEAFKEFLEKNKIEVDKDSIEKRIINYDERYAGTMDALALIDGKFGVLDIKTSQAIYRDYNLQTSAYMAAIKDSVKDVQTRWILRIDQAKHCLKCGALLRSKGGQEKVKIQWNNQIMKQCRHEWSPLRGEIELEEFPYWQKDYEAFLGAKKLWEWENESWLKQAGYL